MQFLFKYLSVFLSVIVSAEAYASPALPPGIYVPAAEAEALRSHAKMSKVQCDSSTGDFASPALRVDADGRAFAYDPYFREAFHAPLGEIDQYLRTRGMEAGQFTESSPNEVKLYLSLHENCRSRSFNKEQTAVDSGMLEQALQARKDLIGMVQIDGNSKPFTLSSKSLDRMALSLAGAVASTGIAAFGYGVSRENRRFIRSMNAILKQYDEMQSYADLRLMFQRSAIYKALGKLPKRSYQKVADLGSNIFKLDPTPRMSTAALKVEIDESKRKVSELVAKYIRYAKINRAAMWVGIGLVAVATVGIIWDSRLSRERGHLDQKKNMDRLIASRPALINFLLLSDDEARRSLRAQPYLAPYLVEMRDRIYAQVTKENP